jgi:NADH dehydrogenase
MPRVVIIGGGFAGLAAARRLARARIRCTLIDRKPHLEFLPMLPELLSQTLDPQLLQVDLAEIAERVGFEFVHAEVTSVDLEERQASIDKESRAFDHLIIAAGSETNFHGREDLASRVLKIDNVADALAIARETDRTDVDTVVISGAGYTGIECATFLRHHTTKRIVILERAPTLLPRLAPWMRHYTVENLQRMSIEVKTDVTLDDYADSVATLSDGSIIERSCVIWATGVQAPSLVRSLDAKHAHQGRLVVDEHLRLHEGVFVAGDSACALDGAGNPMRMAVQISLDEGAVAGENVLREIRGRPLARYRPLDLGWIVPMANFRSCGTALGFHVRGIPATMLHYVMCLFRSLGLGRRLKLLSELIRSRA